MVVMSSFQNVVLGLVQHSLSLIYSCSNLCRTREAHAITNLLYEGWAYLPLTVWVYINYYYMQPLIEEQALINNIYGTASIYLSAIYSYRYWHCGILILDGFIQQIKLTYNVNYFSCTHPYSHNSIKSQSQKY